MLDATQFNSEWTNNLMFMYAYLAINKSNTVEVLLSVIRFIPMKVYFKNVVIPTRSVQNCQNAIPTPDHDERQLIDLYRRLITLSSFSEQAGRVGKVDGRSSGGREFDPQLEQVI